VNSGHCQCLLTCAPVLYFLIFLQVCQSVRTQSRERDHRATNSKDRERSRDGELPLTASQTAARDRAIQQKRREIDEVRECNYTNTHVYLAIKDGYKQKEEAEDLRLGSETVCCSLNIHFKVLSLRRQKCLYLLWFNV